MALVETSDELRLCVKMHSSTEHNRLTCTFIHGFGEGGYIWRDAIRSIADLCNVVVMDLRGHGDSQHSPNGDYKFTQHVADIKKVLDGFVVGPSILVGHSLGGQIAIHIAANGPPTLAGLVLVDICPDPNPDGMRQATENLRTSLKVYRSIEEYKDHILHTRPLISLETANVIAQGALRRTTRGFELKIDPALIASDHTSSGKEKKPVTVTEAQLAEIQIPTLVIRGAGSAVVPLDAAKRMLSSLRRAKLITIPMAGHAVMTDNPDSFVTAIRPFIETIARSCPDMP